MCPIHKNHTQCNAEERFRVDCRRCKRSEEIATCNNNKTWPPIRQLDLAGSSMLLLFNLRYNRYLLIYPTDLRFQITTKTFLTFGAIKTNDDTIVEIVAAWWSFREAGPQWPCDCLATAFQRPGQWKIQSSGLLIMILWEKLSVHQTRALLADPGFLWVWGFETVVYAWL